MEIGGFGIDGELARGASGVVYAGRDPATGEAVAVKLLLQPLDGRGVAGQRFAREVEALKRLDHPALVGILAAGFEQGRPYLVMDMVRGPTLQERLDRGGPLAPREAAEVVQELALALEYVHACGLIHRDLKPGNVILEGGRPRLTDFGLAKDLDPGRSRISKTGIFLGTPGYWAPEQARGEVEAFGPATDIYGLGALLYAALTRSPPVAGGTLLEHLAAMERGEVVPPSLLAPGLDDALERVCLRCLARDPADRYPSADALARDLGRYLRGERPVAARRATRSLGRWSVAGVVAVLLAASVGVGAVGLAGDAGAPPGPTPSRPPGDRPLEPWPPEPARGGVAFDTFEVRGSFDPEHQQVQAALAQAEAMVGRDPEKANPDALFFLGIQHGLLGDWEAALAAFDRVLAAHPDHVAGLGFRGDILRRLGRLDEALRDYERTLALHEDPVHRTNAAVCHLERGAPARALETLDGGDPAGSAAAHHHVNRGLALFHLGRYPEAEAAFAAALDAPSPPAAVAVLARFDRACARAARGDRAGAVGDLRAVAATSDGALGERAARHLADLER